MILCGDTSTSGTYWRLSKGRKKRDQKTNDATINQRFLTILINSLSTKNRAMKIGAYSPWKPTLGRQAPAFSVDGRRRQSNDVRPWVMQWVSQIVGRSDLHPFDFLDPGRVQSFDCSACFTIYQKCTDPRNAGLFFTQTVLRRPNMTSIPLVNMFVQSSVILPGIPQNRLPMSWWSKLKHFISQSL